VEVGGWIWENRSWGKWFCSTMCSPSCCTVLPQAPKVTEPIIGWNLQTSKINIFSLRVDYLRNLLEDGKLTTIVRMAAFETFFRFFPLPFMPAFLLLLH
jgi:hypothetical protein